MPADAPVTNITFFSIVSILMFCWVQGPLALQQNKGRVKARAQVWCEAQICFGVELVLEVKGFLEVKG